MADFTPKEPRSVGETTRILLWITLAIFHILVVFVACYTSAKSVQGYTLGVTVFVILLLYYAHEKRWRHLIAWPLIAYAFYSILVNVYTRVQMFADKANYEALGGAYTIVLYGASNIPYIFCGVSIATTAILGIIMVKTKRPMDRLLKISFGASALLFLLSQINF